jgi:hypothetical protein
MSNFSDNLTPNGITAEVAFQGNAGPVAVLNTLPNSSVLFTAFPIAAMPTAEAATTLDIMAGICTPDVPDPCVGDTNGDNDINIDDLLTVLGEFGTAGINGNVDGVGGVDINDLLLVLGLFGTSCP